MKIPRITLFDSNAYRMHITVRFRRPTSCEYTDHTQFPPYLAPWLATQSDEGGATAVKPDSVTGFMSSDEHCHGAAAVLGVFTVRLSPLFQCAISHCNSVYGETLLSNLRGSSVGSLHLFLYNLCNAAFACVLCYEYAGRRG
jgi:hypothetical protein